METNRRARIEELFEAALELPADERSGWLRAVCGGDDELREQVKALLGAHEVAERVFEPARAPEPMRRIGPYRVVRELGRGGMGVVYLAERDDGHFRRRVAIKLLRGSPDGEELHRRFRAERQILASLEHPNIAQLLDGGVTDGELPYLVMEYVDGQTITTYCDRHRLTVHQRIELFRDVCAAVHHAHRNLVIHRDLKPSNIMVTPDGQVKLLDFGIAKLLNPMASVEDAPVTRTEFRILTPDYASPEQVRGDTLTTTSDVYALGVVLYELLTGEAPYRLANAAPRDIVDLVCERDPERPSSQCLAGDDALARARARATTPERLRRRLRGDLDAITMMALRKEPRLRYGSAELLAEDLKRHEDGLPVVAHQGTRRYRLEKFLRRHKIQAAAAAVVMLSILGGAGTAVQQARQASIERDRAGAALREAEAVTAFLMNLFAGSSPNEGQGLDLTAGDLLRRGAARVDSLAGEPVVHARTLFVIGEVYSSLGRFADAETYMERATDVVRDHFGRDHLEYATALNRLGLLARHRGDLKRAQALHTEALAIQRQRLGEAHPDIAQTLGDLGWVSADDPAEVERLYRAALDMRVKTLGPDHPLVANSLLNVGSVLRRSGKLTESERYFRDAVALRARVYGDNDPLTAESMLHLADMLVRIDQDAEADRLYRRALTIQRRVLGSGSLQLIHGLHSLASLSSRRGDHAEAEALLREAVEIRKAALGDNHWAVAGSISALGREYARQGRFDEAEAMYRDALVLYERAFGRVHHNTSGLLTNLGLLLADAGRYDEAEAVLRESVAIRTATGSNAPVIAVSVAALADVQRRAGRYTEADQNFAEAIAILKQHYDDEHPHARAIYYRYAKLHAALGHGEEAQRFLALSRNDSVVDWPNLP